MDKIKKIVSLIPGFGGNKLPFKIVALFYYIMLLSFLFAGEPQGVVVLIFVAFAYNKLFNSKANGSYYCASVNYLGGHPEVSNPTSGTLIINKDGVHFAKSKNRFGIQFQDIKKSEFKSQEQIEKDVTFTRLLLLGIFAFAFKKRKVYAQNFLVITYDEFGIDNTVVFETEKANIITSRILKARRESVERITA